MKEVGGDVTALLASFPTGDPEITNQLFSIIYAKLHAIAHSTMRSECHDRRLDTTELINETYINLIQNKDKRWKNRQHFFSVASRAMRCLLVDEARKRRAAKRGGEKPPLSMEQLTGLDQKIAAKPEPSIFFEYLDRALLKLKSHPRICTVVEMRFFIGMTLDQIAEALDISKATVCRDWDFAKAWLRKEMDGAVNTGS